MNRTELFKKNERLIYKQSWHYAKKYSIDFDEIKSQAFLIFCEAIDRFDNSRSGFTTFLFHRLRTLNDYCKQQKRIIYNTVYLPEPGEDGAGEIPAEDNTEERIMFDQALDRLSDDGKHVVENLLCGSFEKPEMDRRRSPGKYRIREVLTKEYGWTHSRVDKVWRELHRWYVNNN